MLKINLLAVLVACCLFFTACGGGQSTENNQSDTVQSDALLAGTDPITFRFAILGCNRLDRHDTSTVRKLTGDPSTANTYALQRVLNELPGLTPKPSMFFFMGDMVTGESNLADLDRQLNYWTRNLQSTSYSKFPGSNIQMVAIPGNHEMLAFESSCTVPNHTEFPLQGSIGVWNKYITAPTFIPANRTDIGDANFTFTQTIGSSSDKVGFVVLNTDTYENPTPANPCTGTESYIPWAAIQKQVGVLKSDPTVKYIFAIGHKPCGTDVNFGGSPHDVIQNGKAVFQWFDGQGTIAMLSAHKHLYNQFLPTGATMRQVIVGNGGSPLESGTTFGYGIVDIHQSGAVTLTPMEFQAPTPYYSQISGATAAGTVVKLK